jgi:isopropylmalate/homocitrate/citramalate synthase
MHPNDYFAQYNQRNIKGLFKSFLILIEDLQKDHEITFSKLKDAMPPEYKTLINQADYFDQEKLKYLRKKVLDMGNEAIRVHDNELENFTVSFKF